MLLLVLGLFLILIAPLATTQGMFMDGAIYAVVARNLALDLGTLGKPYMTETFLTPFVEHPPFAIFLQSFTYRLFGDHWWVDKLYSIFTVLFSGFLIKNIWTLLTQDKTNAWLPLLMYITIESIFWSATNNMLENTVTLFILSYLWAFLKYIDKQKIGYLVFAGIFFLFASLSKGVFAFFSLGIPFFWWLFNRGFKFKQMFFSTVLILVSAIFFLGIFVYFIDELGESLFRYFDKQVLRRGVGTEQSIFPLTIFKKYFNNLITPLIIALIIWITHAKFKINKPSIAIRKGWSLIAIGISGVIPICFSPVQSSFYIIPVYGFTVLGLAIILQEKFQLRLHGKWQHIKFQKWAAGFGLLLMVTSVGIMTQRFGKDGRDHQLLEDIRAINDQVGSHQTIRIEPNLWNHWMLHTYLYRYHFNSISRKKGSFLIRKKIPNSDSNTKSLKVLNQYTLEKLE
jgi:4-amino-4-deoxy-L-arabinose transferase-like glycosyltransferase